MGCCNEPATTLATATLDPSQHVNFARGMVLGVDDFTQEFAYLTGRDQWLARDAVGYGTLSGLRVFAELAGEQGPRIHVTAGTALVPSGRLVCVPADQCAAINRWLAKRDNAAIVTRLMSESSPAVSPPVEGSGRVSLFLTLCYADCRTRPVPIPGEPCRSDDEQMAPSRVADDFRLELRERPPEQDEEDALRDFVLWLRTSVRVEEVSPPAAGDDASWLGALRAAAGPWLDAAAASPPASVDTLGDYLFDLSPAPLSLAPGELRDFLRLAFRFWVTELRPLWMARRCHRVEAPDDDCVLLARVEMDVAWIGGSPTGAWQVAGSPVQITIDETRRPLLYHLRLLQEWLLAGPAIEAAAGAGAGSGGGGGGEDGGGGGGGAYAPDSAPYILAFDDLSLPGAQSLGGLGSGLLMNSVAGGAGTLSSAVAGTDYYAPGSGPVSVADGGTGLASPPADGQLLVGSAGGYTLAEMTGTDGVLVARDATGIRISPPQPLQTSSVPSFNGLVTTGSVRVAVTIASPTGGTPAMTLDVGHHVVLCDPATVKSITLPSAIAGTRGRIYIIRNTGTGSATVTVSATGSDRVEGGASTQVRRGDAKTFVSNGTGAWFVIATVV